jgi:hypothetical protein
MTTAAEPFRVTIRDGMVLVDAFSPQIHRFYVDLERELPVVRDAMARLVAEGQTRFIFDVRTAEPGSVYPIVKWGLMYGVLAARRRLEPDTPAAVLAQSIKLVGDDDLLEEVKLYYLDRLFERHDTVESAIRALD